MVTPLKEQEQLLAEIYSHPRDSRIQFLEEEHIYVLDGNQAFPRSVSKLVSQCFDEFKPIDTAKRYLYKWRSDPESKYHALIAAAENELPPNISAAELIATSWAANGAHKSELGRLMHLSIEYALNNMELPHMISQNKLSSGSLSGIPVISRTGKSKSVAVPTPKSVSSKTRDIALSPSSVCLTSPDATSPSGTSNARSSGMTSPLSCDKAKLLAPTVFSILTSSTMGSLREEEAAAVISQAFSNNLLSKIKVKNLTVSSVENEIKAWREWKNTLGADLEPIRTEWSIFSTASNIAGQIDALFRNTKTGKFVLIDWKRVDNLSPTTDSKFPRYSKHPSLSDVPDTKYWHYALQVNIYAYILDKYYCIRDVELRLVQIHPSLPSPGFKEHVVEPMSKQLIESLLVPSCEDVMIPLMEESRRLETLKGVLEESWK